MQPSVFGSLDSDDPHQQDTSLWCKYNLVPRLNRIPTNLREKSLTIWYVLRFLICIYLPSGKRLHNYGKSPFSMGKLTISMAIFNSFLYVYPRVYTYPHILFWLLQCLYITVCVERHSVFVLLINMIARWVPTQTVLSSFPPFSVGKPLPFVQPERSESQVLHWTSACQSSKMVHSTTVFMRIPITEVSRCPNSHCPFKTPIKMPKFHKNPIDYHRLSPKLPWIPTFDPLQADLLRLLRSIRPSVGEDEAAISPLLGCSSTTNHGYWAFSSEISSESLCVFVKWELLESHSFEKHFGKIWSLEF